MQIWQILHTAKIDWKYAYVEYPRDDSCPDGYEVMN
jgi:hypothetical protein